MGEQLPFEVPFAKEHEEILQISKYELNRRNPWPYALSEETNTLLEERAQNLCKLQRVPEPLPQLQAEPHMHSDLLRWNRHIQEALIGA